MTQTQMQKAALSSLKSAIQIKDADAAEIALNAAFHAGLHTCMTSALVKLCDAGWHTRHEDVVNALQAVGDTSAIPALERTAHIIYSYLDYDETFGLARKCTWALADIGSEEARHALERISNSTNSFIAEYANKRLKHWQNELQRKRA